MHPQTTPNPNFKMITQQPICLKIHKELLEELDLEVQNAKSRNWIINRAVHVYLKLMDARRLASCLTEKDKADTVESWLKEYFPEAAHW